MRPDYDAAEFRTKAVGVPQNWIMREPPKRKRSYLSSP